jgi:hypothetical protein
MVGCTKEDPKGGQTQKIYREAQGTTGNLTWKLTSNGALTISGKGAMPDYEAELVDEKLKSINSPWFDLEFVSVVIKSGVTTIGNSAFDGCTSLTRVTIPNSVTTIEGWAFRGCTGLTSVTIGNSVWVIEDWAFVNCTGLTSVTIMSTTPRKLGLGNFRDNSNDTLHVPAGCVATYEADEDWREVFTNIVEQR